MVEYITVVYSFYVGIYVLYTTFKHSPKFAHVWNKYINEVVTGRDI